MRIVPTWNWESFSDTPFPATTERIRIGEVFFERVDGVHRLIRQAASLGFGAGIVLTLLVLWACGAFK